MAKRKGLAGLIGRRGAQAAQDGPDEDDRPEAEDDEDEQATDAAEAKDDDDEEAEDASGKNAGAAAVKADRKRVAAIMDHKVAADLPSLAGHLALKTDVSAKAAGRILSAAAEDLESTDDSGSDGSTAARVYERMEAANPNVGTNSDGGGNAGPSLASFVKQDIEANPLA